MGSKAYDPASAFPTAALVAAMRAEDAKLAQPLIGTKVSGAKADFLAAGLAGDYGAEMLLEYAKALDVTPAIQASYLACRTNWFDERIMTSGAQQIVLLGAGLDTRAWRLPCESATIFEVDVKRAHDFKESRLKELPGAPTTERADRKISMAQRCKRVLVEADLSVPGWAQEQLVLSGFNPSQPAFFLAEGLLMYMPDEAAVEVLFREVRSVMAPGSSFAVCTFMGGMKAGCATMVHEFATKHGFQWTFEFEGDAELRAALGAAHMELVELKQAGKHKSKEDVGRSVAEVGEVDAARAQEMATKLRELVTAEGLREWPAAELSWASLHIASADGSEEEGAACVAQSLASDEDNKNGWREETASTKARAVALVLEAGFAEALVGNLKQLFSTHGGGPAYKLFLAKPAA